MRILGINVTEIIAGGITVAVGVFTLAEAMTYRIGSARSMGPGYFPSAIGIALIVIGLAIILVEGRRGDDSLPPRPAFRALLAIMAAIGAFAALIDSFGLAPAVMAAVFLSTLAEEKTRFVQALLLGAGLAVLTVVIFHFGLGLQVEAIRW